MGEINYTITEAQAKDICNHFGKDADTMENWEVCELLDKVIDNYLSIAE